jgi:hypothetical protein
MALKGNPHQRYHCRSSACYVADGEGLIPNAPAHGADFDDLKAQGCSTGDEADAAALVEAAPELPAAPSLAARLASFLS